MSIQHVALFFVLSFSALAYCWLPILFHSEYAALFILLVKSSLTRWHWWLLFFFSHFSTFDADSVWVCGSIANDPLHLTIFTCFHPLSQTTLDFHSLIHSFYIHSIEYNGWKKSLTKLNAFDNKKKHRFYGHLNGYLLFSVCCV